MSSRDRSTERSYKTIAEELIRRISRLQVPNGAYLPTERELQEEFEVSRTTVRRALSALVEAGYAESVPNRGVVAKSGTQSVAQTLAFIDGSSVVLRDIFAGLSSDCLHLGYHLLHINSENLGLANAIRLARAQGCVGAFAWSFEGFPAEADLRDAVEGFPLVLLDHSIRGFEFDLVTHDFHAAAKEIVTHMLESGRGEIAVSGMLDMLDVTRDRFNGYLQGLFDFGTKPNVRNFAFCYTSDMDEPDTSLLAARLRMDPPLDGIFVLQDEFAPAVARAVLEAGFRIPEDVALTAIGDDIAVTIGDVGLTVIRCDWPHVRHEALRLLLERLDRPSKPVETVHVAHSLVRRGSCGTPTHQSSQPTRFSAPTGANLISSSRPAPVTGRRSLKNL
jgi:DNA-binding LacI/PurR family transcriptional regulator